MHCFTNNIFWWGLDLVADGLVLVFVAGTWYLLAMLSQEKISLCKISHVRRSSFDTNECLVEEKKEGA